MILYWISDQKKYAMKDNIEKIGQKLCVKV